MASNRKNKLICYWDYELELKWECVKKINANDKITGIYFATVLKWGVSSRWSSFQCCHMQNSGQVTIEKTHPTLVNV